MSTPHLIDALHDLDTALEQPPAEAPAERPGTYADVVMTDGTAFSVRITNREYLAWDKTAPRHGWGKPADVPFLLATFLAFAAAKREGLFGGTFDAFKEAVDDVDQRKVDGEEGPTR